MKTKPTPSTLKSKVIPVRFSTRTVAGYKFIKANYMTAATESEILRIAAQIGIAVLMQTKGDVETVIARAYLNLKKTEAPQSFCDNLDEVGRQAMDAIAQAGSPEAQLPGRERAGGQRERK